MNIQQAATKYLPRINTEMKQIMAPSNSDIDPFWGMMHFHLGWLDEELSPTTASLGKQLRPLFTVLACEAFGGNPALALPAAAAIELTHNFTLIHDDIEDNSATRRGRKTVWRLWGAPQAINAGDAMFTIARNALLRLRRHNISAETILTAMEKYDETIMALCRGQYLDMSFEQTMTVTLDAYLEMIAGKTAALLACAGYLGALIATDDARQAEKFWEFGHALGLAFQMQDDLLGIWGDAAMVGKPSGDDLRQRKKSLPVIFALNQTASQDAARFREIYIQPAEMTSENDISEAIDLLEKLGAREYTVHQAESWVGKAGTTLAVLDFPLEKHGALQEFSDMMIKRAK